MRADLPGITLLPVTDPDIPPATPRFMLDEPVGCVAAVAVRGTDYERRADRARAATSHALRILRIRRVAVRAYPGIAEQQLRFRLGLAYAFGKGLTG